MEENSLYTRRVTISNSLGMHARPAAKIAEIAGKAVHNVWIINDNSKADAQSVIDILSLCIIEGSLVTVEVESANDVEILDEIIKLIESGFGE
ncbi:MAG: HPr family phosphocarrier protein [Desulfarculaceae bacterium]|nr:HPr family phosphocarrier protein [Desulfarculaceae bacterium]